MVVKEFFITGQPIKTNLGYLRFIKVGEYQNFIPFIHLFSLTNWEIIKYKKDQIASVVDRQAANRLLQPFENLTRFELICEFKEDYFYFMFRSLFEMLFEEDVFDNIKDSTEFESLIDIIMKMNCIKKEEKSINPELQYFNDLQSQLNSKRNNISFESVYSSVWVSTGLNPNDLTLYQFYSLFNRISKFKEFESTSMYSCVGDVKVVNFAEHVDMFAESRKESIQEFEKRAKALVK